MNMARIDKDGNNIDMSKTVVYKIEVPANRYDLLCLEGIATALRSYLAGIPFPFYSLITPQKKEQIFVKPCTKNVRQYVVSCILRNIKFDV
jgi:phenylalanyl-tRNA synthetase beta chain